MCCCQCATPPPHALHLPSPCPHACRYKEVQPDSFGLAVEDILGLEDKDLNQVVGLKKLAPYRCVW